MAKINRFERMDDLRVEQEASYRTALISALKTAASGSWGLFGHNKDRQAQAKWSPVLKCLQELADEIDELREKLQMEPFALHAEFLLARGPVAADAPGEPKQAAAWLARLSEVKA